MADLWPDHPAAAVASANDQWPDHPAASQIAQPQATPQPSGFLQGLGDPTVGAAQLGSHLSGGWTPEQLMLPEGQRGGPAQSDAFVNQREGDYQAQRSAAGQTGTDWSRIAGNVASPQNFIPLGPPGSSLAARAGMGALTSAALGTQPVTGDNYWQGAAENAAVNAGLGAVTGPIAGTIRGNRSPDAQMLQDAGVMLTPGQSGGMLAKTSEALGSKLPIVKNIVAAHQENAIDSFNRAAINHALEPIGEKLSPETAAGHDAIAEMAEKASNAYKSLIPDGGAAFDGTAQVGLDRLRANAKLLLPPDRAQQFDNFVQSNVVDKLDNWKTTGQPFTNFWMSGRTFKDIDKSIGNEAATYSGYGTKGDEAKLGEMYQQLRGTLRDWAERVNPDVPGVQAANQTYARMLRVQDAAARGKDGIFTPQNLVASVKSYAGPVQYARGNGLMQDLAETGQRVIGSSRGPSRAPATAADLLTTDILGTAIGLGGAGMGGASQGGYLPDWASYAAALTPALALTRPGAGLLSAFSPGGPARGLLGQAAVAAPGRTANGLLNY